MTLTEFRRLFMADPERRAAIKELEREKERREAERRAIIELPTDRKSDEAA